MAVRKTCGHLSCRVATRRPSLRRPHMIWMRLSVVVAAPRAAIIDVLARHHGLRAMFCDGWLHLMVVEEAGLRPATGSG